MQIETKIPQPIISREALPTNAAPLALDEAAFARRLMLSIERLESALARPISDSDTQQAVRQAFEPKAANNIQLIGTLKYERHIQRAHRLQDEPAARKLHAKFIFSFFASLPGMLVGAPIAGAVWATGRSCYRKRTEGGVREDMVVKAMHAMQVLMRLRICCSPDRICATLTHGLGTRSLSH